MVGELAALIERSSAGASRQSPIPGLTLLRADASADALAEIHDPATHEPTLCVVVQGRKTAWVGSATFTYEPDHYALITVGLPVTQTVIETVGGKPFLGLQLTLDPAMLTELLSALPPDPGDERAAWTIALTPLTPDLLAPLIRLVQLLADPQDAAVLAPGIHREILYRLLRGPQRHLLREIAAPDSRLSQIRRAIEWIRENFATPFRVESVAAVARMSPSSFHQHFKAVTSMSPLQYQKHLRLHEARRMIFSGQVGATTAGLRVGYDSASQFSREYKRLFGAPPLRDFTRLRR